MYPMVDNKEVEFAVIDLMKMTRQIYPVSQAHAKIIVQRFKSIYEYDDNQKVGANSLPMFINFLGMFTRKVLEIRNEEVWFCTPGAPTDIDILRVMHDSAQSIKTEI
jgi:hypothetical protein